MTEILLSGVQLQKSVEAMEVKRYLQRQKPITNNAIEFKIC
jgi:hypothetical protein